MVQYKMSEQMVADLAPFKEWVECVDDQGIFVGYFMPPEAAMDWLRRKASREYDAEKARRCRENPGDGLTTEQLLVYLRSLDV